MTRNVSHKDTVVNNKNASEAKVVETPDKRKAPRGRLCGVGGGGVAGGLPAAGKVWNPARGELANTLDGKALVYFVRGHGEYTLVADIMPREGQMKRPAIGA